MVTQAPENALTYIDALIESMRTHVPDALEQFDMTAIHQARVATRRLKAALGLLSSLSDEKGLEALNEVGKKLRRRLGPLRDLDVMIDSLATLKLPARVQVAANWLKSQMEIAREHVRLHDQAHGKSSDKLLLRFDRWYVVRASIQRQEGAIAPLLVKALHERFRRFSHEATAVALGQNDSHEPIDVHQLRIDGKLVRYTFELADAQGLKVPKRVFRTFKALQELLGTWHDRVVLSEQTLKFAVEQELAHHDAEMMLGVLELSRYFLQSSKSSLHKFNSMWLKVSPEMSEVLHGKIPMVVSESQTDPDPVETPRSPPEAVETASVPQDV